MKAWHRQRAAFGSKLAMSVLGAAGISLTFRVRGSDYGGVVWYLGRNLKSGDEVA